jgi:hypothetical protein
LRTFWGLLLLGIGLTLPAAAETFRNPRHIAIPSNPLQVGTADFNGDGRPDFYYVDASGLNVILGNPDGSYAAPRTTSLGSAMPPATALGPATGSCQAADFNGDGFADAVCFPLVWATTPSPVIFIGNGDGTLHLDSTLSIPNNLLSQGSELVFVAFADINSDGHLDIVFSSSTGTLVTAFGNGSGQFENLVSFQNNSVTVTVKALYGFAGSVSLSCQVAYLGSGTDASPPTCGFGTSTLPGSDASTQLIVSTTAATAADHRVAGHPALGKTSIVLWGGVLLLLLPRRLRPRWLATAMMILVVSGSMLSLSSCGGTASLSPPTGTPGTPPPTSPPPTGTPGTQAGSYSITVSAVSDSAAPPPPPVTVQLTVN